MKLVYKEWGSYVAYRTHNVDTDELKEYLKDNFVGLDTLDVNDEVIKDILYHSVDWEDTMIYDKVTEEAYYLVDIVEDWVQDSLYTNDYEWEICDADVTDDELIEIEK